MQAMTAGAGAGRHKRAEGPDRRRRAGIDVKTATAAVCTTVRRISPESAAALGPANRSAGATPTDRQAVAHRLVRIQPRREMINLTLIEVPYALLPAIHSGAGRGICRVNAGSAIIAWASRLRIAA
jgi:hypothetical protein